MASSLWNNFINNSIVIKEINAFLMKDTKCLINIDQHHLLNYVVMLSFRLRKK